MQSIKRVLMVHPYGIGDLLFATPVFRALRLIPTVERVDLLLGSRTEAMICTNPHIDEIYSVDKDLFHRQSFIKNFGNIVNLGKELRENRYDLLLDYSSRREYAWLSQWFLGIHRRSGLDYKGRACFHTHRLSVQKGFSDRHVIDYFAELAEMVGVSVKSRFVEFYVSEEAQKKSKEILQKEGLSASDSFLVLSPGGGESWGKDASLKRWPTKYFSAFLNQLHKLVSFDKVVILGSEKEKTLGKTMTPNLKMPCLDLTGQSDIMTAAAVIQQAKLYVGNDGGLTHIAHALRKPLIALYGPADPKIYGPYPTSEKALALYEPERSEGPCYAQFRYNAHCRCLQNLTPERALEKLKKSRFLETIGEKIKGLA